MNAQNHRANGSAGKSLLEASPGEFRAIGELVRALGTIEFREALLTLLREATGADLCAAFLTRLGQPTCVAVASRYDQGAATIAARRYVERYWRHDKIWNDARDFEGHPVWQVPINKILDKKYREDCFDENDAIDKLALVRKFGSESVCVSLFKRRPSAGFSKSEIDSFSFIGDVLTSAVVKHSELLNLSSQRPASLIPKIEAIALVSAACPQLSPQEREVCGRILAGMSSRAIAIDLDLTYSSILTYRKRAYSRIGITSQGELFALCFRSDRAGLMANQRKLS
jgi:DNA-binding CsgD family transcriptional regulator